MRSPLRGAGWAGGLSCLGASGPKRVAGGPVSCSGTEASRSPCLSLLRLVGVVLRGTAGIKADLLGKSSGRAGRGRGIWKPAVAPCLHTPPVLLKPVRNPSAAAVAAGRNPLVQTGCAQ